MACDEDRRNQLDVTAEALAIFLQRIARLEAALREIADAEARDIGHPSAYPMFVASLAGIAKDALKE